MKKTTRKIIGLACLLVSSLAMSQVTANQPQDIFMCDINNPGDGVEIFDLTTTIPEIIGDQTNVTVTFHLTSGGALGNDNGFPNPESYENVVNPQLIFVRVQGPGESVITTFTIEVRLPFEPDTTTPEPLILPDPEGDGFEVFDLTNIIPQFTNDPFVLNITYHETLQDAESNVNPIADPENYTNVTNPQTLYVRFQNAPGEECVTIVPFDVFADANLAVQDFNTVNVNLYPNPTTSVMTIENIDLESDITIYDTLGRVVLSQRSTDTTIVTMDVSNLNKGIYFVRINDIQPLTFIKN